MFFTDFTILRYWSVLKYLFENRIIFAVLEFAKLSKFNLFVYQSRVEFSDESNEIVFNTVSPVSFMQIKFKTHFYIWIFLSLSENLLGQNRAPYQI